MLGHQKPPNIVKVGLDWVGRDRAGNLWCQPEGLFNLTTLRQVFSFVYLGEPLKKDRLGDKLRRVSPVSGLLLGCSWPGVSPKNLSEVMKQSCYDDG